MKKITFIIFFLFSFSFSQTVSTKFIRNGVLTNKPNTISKSTCEFKKKRKVEVLDYIINDWWKVRYNNCTGFVTTSFILVSDELLKIKEDKIEDIYKKETESKDSIKLVNTSIKRVNDSIQKIKKLLEEKEIKRIDSIKVIILDYAKDSLLQVNVRKGSKLKTEPILLGEIILTTEEDKRVIIMDYINNYFKVCIDSKCGYMNEVFFNTGGIFNFKMESELLTEFKRIKEADNKVRIYLEKLKRLEKEKETYINECSYDTNERDEFTGIVRKNTILYNIDEYENSNLEIQLRKYGNSKYVEIKSTLDLGCTSPYSSGKSNVKLKLKNGDIITFYHIGDIDCGSFNLLGKLTLNDIIRLKKSSIKTVRLSGTKFYHDFKNLFFENFFIKKLDCIK